MLEIRDLQHLLALDEHRHFRRAANSLGISQPALTKSLQRLEQELGAKLFDRAPGRVCPTSIGERTITMARGLVHNADELRRTVDLLRGVEIGSVAIGVGPAMSESYVTAAIADAIQEHPHTRVSIRVDHWRQLSQWVLAGELDFCVADIGDASEDERFEYVPLPPEDIVWFCRAGHPLASMQTVSRCDLLRYPLATPKMPDWASSWFENAAEQSCSEHGIKKEYPAIECESYSMLKQLVLASDCISAALRGTINPQLQEGTVAILSVDAPGLRTEAGVIRPRGRTVSPLAAVLMKRIQEVAIDVRTHLTSPPTLANGSSTGPEPSPVGSPRVSD